MATYQQALDDFGIVRLLQKLIVIAPESLEMEERESLAALLIEQLTSCLDRALIAQYLNFIDAGDGNVISDQIAIELQSVAIASARPLNCLPPKESASGFQIGDRVQWKPLSDCSTDWGTVIGRFYTYARHRLQWGWKYVVWLDDNSPSSVWTAADTAWEDDLQPMN